MQEIQTIGGWEIATRGPLLCFYDSVARVRVVVHMNRVDSYWTERGEDRVKLVFLVYVPRNDTQAHIHLMTTPEYIDQILSVVDDAMSVRSIVEKV